MNIDPTVPCDDQTGDFVILAAINAADNRPYPLVVNPITGELRVNAEFTGDVIVDIDLPESTNGKTLVLTGGADRLPDVALKSGLVIESDEDNANDLRVGGSDVTIAFGFRLSPGESVPIVTENQNTVYVFGVVGDEVHYLSG